MPINVRIPFAFFIVAFLPFTSTLARVHSREDCHSYNPAKTAAKKDPVALLFLNAFESGKKPSLRDLQPGRAWECSMYGLRLNRENGEVSVRNSEPVRMFRFQHGANESVVNSVRSELPSIFAPTSASLRGKEGEEETYVRVTPNHDLIGVREAVTSESALIDFINCQNTSDATETDPFSTALAAQFEVAHPPVESELQIGTVWSCTGMYADLAKVENTHSTILASVFNFHPSVTGQYKNVGDVYPGVYFSSKSEEAVVGYSLDASGSEPAPVAIFVRADDDGNLIVKRRKRDSVDYLACAKDQTHLQ